MDTINKIYFLGIGGIGMSALARYFNNRGVAVFGYDRTQTDLTKDLEEEGMTIHYDEDVEKIPDHLDLVVFTPAIPKENKELIWLESQPIPLKKRAEVLGMISRDRKTIAIAGTHGKTTTSSIVTHLLHAGHVDCSAFLGGIATNFESNFIDGASEWLVVEADEYDRSFLHLHPDLAVILSMDADHLDIYGSEDSILESGYLAFAKQVDAAGKLWVNDRFKDHFKNKPVLTFGQHEGDVQISNIRVDAGKMIFDLKKGNQLLSDLIFPLPGNHNVMNAGIAAAVALEVGVSEENLRKGLASFKGIKRRFEIMHRGPKTVYVDDYAHHPTELEAAIEAAKTFFPRRKITGIFQPHLFSRTRDFADGFAAALDHLDQAILMPIYPAREKPIPGVDAQLLRDKMKHQRSLILNEVEVLDWIKQNEVDVLLTLGAGNIDRLRGPISAFLKNNDP